MRFDIRSGNHLIVQPDGNRLLTSLILLLGGLREGFPALRLEHQLHHRGGTAGILIVNHGAAGIVDVVAVDDQFAGRPIDDVAVFILDSVAVLVLDLFPFVADMEFEHGGLAEFLNRGLCIKLGFVRFPREAGDYLLVGNVSIHLRVGDIVIDQALLDHAPDILHLFLGYAQGFIHRSKRHIHAAADIDTKADILRSADDGIGPVAILTVHAKKGGVGQRYDQQGNDEEYGFWCSLHRHVLQCSLRFPAAGQPAPRPGINVSYYISNEQKSQRFPPICRGNFIVCTKRQAVFFHRRQSSRREKTPARGG